MMDLSEYIGKVPTERPLRFCGYVDRITGLIVEAVCPPARIGDFCTIIGEETIFAKKRAKNIIIIEKNRVKESMMLLANSIFSSISFN
jgi:flagellar biosynthesis/type III secretory pathway ATPase